MAPAAHADGAGVCRAPRQGGRERGGSFLKQVGGAETWRHFLQAPAYLAAGKLDVSVSLLDVGWELGAEDTFELSRFQIARHRKTKFAFVALSASNPA